MRRRGGWGRRATVLRIRFRAVGRRVSRGGGRVREEWCAVCVGVRTRGEGERWGERRDDRGAAKAVSRPKSETRGIGDPLCPARALEEERR